MGQPQTSLHLTKKKKNHHFCSKLNPSEQEKVVQHLNLARQIARHYSGMTPDYISEEDLFPIGVLGLIEAVKRFIAPKNKQGKFRAYAKCRIRGAIQDELRRVDVLSRSKREKLKKFQKAVSKLRVQLNRPPQRSEICKEAKIDPLTYQEIQGIRAKAQYGRLELLEIQNDDEEVCDGIWANPVELSGFQNPEEILQHKERKQVLLKVLGKLKEKDRRMLALKYFREMSLKEMSQVFSLTESRLSQIHSQVINSLQVDFKNKSFSFENLF